MLFVVALWQYVLRQLLLNQLIGQTNNSTANGRHLLQDIDTGGLPLTHRFFNRVQLPLHTAYAVQNFLVLMDVWHGESVFSNILECSIKHTLLGYFYDTALIAQRHPYSALNQKIMVFSRHDHHHIPPTLYTLAAFFTHVAFLISLTLRMLLQ